MKLKFLTTRKRIVREFAEEIANLQKRADEIYYKDTPVKFGENEHASWLLDQVNTLKDFSAKLGITKQVYNEAYKIYDFSNSGKDGYILKDGKIVKID